MVVSGSLFARGLRQESGGLSPNEVLRQVHSGDFLRRTETVKTILIHSQLLANSEIQHSLIALFEKESNDPRIEGREEFVKYSEYYDSLAEAVQEIADHFHSSEAWLALLRSFFDDSSPVAAWIIKRPEAVPYLFVVSKDQDDVVRGRSHILLAKELARCINQSFDSSCLTPLENANRIKSLLRVSAQDAHFQMTQLSSVRGLGLCGDAQDIASLNGLFKTNSSRWFGMYLNKSIKQIEDREKVSR